MELPVPGQRWVSDSEPELGLGIVLQCGFGRVEVMFPAAQEQRQYALKTAPLRRVEFQPGDKIKTHAGAELVVETVELRAGLRVYRTSGGEVAEAELSDSISFSKPEERLFAGQVDDLDQFELRLQTLRRRGWHRQSPARGFGGGRVDLLAHQMFIAGEVTARVTPRVLLADEVGLGKTIEAGLILHRLHLTGRAGRVLILVPEPLLHQWFVELLRRFNLLFSLFDEERCEAIEAHEAGVNPFLDSQLVLCATGYLAENAIRAEQARAAGWDLLVVDEAHHLTWSAAAPSAAYRMVEGLARQTEALLLLTATPQQLGPEGHFARLRLLDPERYADLGQFREEAEHYAEVAQAAGRVREGKGLTKAEEKLFAQKSPRVRRAVDELAGGEATARERLLAALVDEFGTGRVMFRNTRAALAGFPRREAKPVALAAGEEMAVKVAWLVGLLGKLKGEKVLLIGRSRELAEQISARVLAALNVPVALFHEGLTLLQRDRNAAYFAEEEGARLLICSEIGSEGRNFQFAHHLVLWDLPRDPELLEQRIGRLDRIGQTETIRIHVPYLPGSENELLARWYAEGLNAFEENLPGAAQVLAELEGELAAALEKPTPARMKKLLAKSRTVRAAVAARLEQGQDRLLELSSCRPEKAAELIRAVRVQDADGEFEAFLVRLLDHFGVQVEELAARTYLVKPGHLLTDAFPSLPEEGLSVTFERARALSREDLGFMSADHPLVRATQDLLLGAETGNSAFGIWKQAGGEAIFLEVVAVFECVAPAALHLDRFLPAAPIRVAVDHALKDCSEEAGLAAARLEKGDVFRLLDRGAVKKKLLPAMFAQANALLAEQAKKRLEAATNAARAQLRGEVERLEGLRAINGQVRAEEVAAAQRQQEGILAALGEARLRTDALRLIFREG